MLFCMCEYSRDLALVLSVTICNPFTICINISITFFIPEQQWIIGAPCGGEGPHVMGQCTLYLEVLMGRVGLERARLVGLG